MFGNRAIRQGDWKLLYLLKEAGGPGDWQLFNLREDPAELHDLSSQHPEKRQALLKLWDEYVTTNGVVLTNEGPFASHGP
jgi:arylsulfatase